MAQAKRRVKLMAMILSPVLFFGLAEVVLRAVGFRFDPVEVYAAGEWFDELVERKIYSPHPRLIWTLKPSTRIDVPQSGMLGVRTNSLGLRGEVPPPEKEPGELRVFCLGDSVTFGLGREDGKTWPDRLGEALRASPALAGRKVRVLNGAVPGWSSVQGMRLLSDLSELRPDVVVFWFGLNDAKEARGAPDSEMSAPGGGAEDAVRALRGLRVVQLIQAGVVAVRRAGWSARRVSVEEYRAAVRGLLDGAAEGGPVPIFVRYPERLSVTVSQLRTITGRAEEEGVEVVVGPVNLLLPATPARAGTDLVGRKVVTEDGPVLVFDETRAEAKSTLESLRYSLGWLAAAKETLDGFLAELPEESLGYEDLFGDAPPARIYRDNCHLTEYGSALAGAAVARRVLEILREEGR